MTRRLPDDTLTDERITAIAEAIAREMHARFNKPGDAMAALGTALRMTAHMAGITDERLLKSLGDAWRDGPLGRVQ